MESDEHAISMNGNETSAMGSDPSEAEEDGRAGTAEEYHEIHDQRGAKMRGGPDGPTGLMIAAALPSCEGLADRFRRHDPTLTEAEALEEDAAAREAALDVLEKVLTEEDG